MTESEVWMTTTQPPQPQPQPDPQSESQPPSQAQPDPSQSDPQQSESQAQAESESSRSEARSEGGLQSEARSEGGLGSLVGGGGPNEAGYRSFVLGEFTFSRDDYFVYVGWPTGSHVASADAFLKALQRS